MSGWQEGLGKEPLQMHKRMRQGGSQGVQGQAQSVLVRSEPGAAHPKAHLCQKVGEDQSGHHGVEITRFVAQHHVNGPPALNVILPGDKEIDETSTVTLGLVPCQIGIPTPIILNK